TLNVARLQRQAGVPRDEAELIGGYARLVTDAGRALELPVPIASLSPVARARLADLQFKNPDVSVGFLAVLAGDAALLEDKGLPAIFTVRHFAEQVDIHQGTLRRMCCRQREYYLHFEIPKANGTARVIASPRGAMRRAQRWIQHRVLRQVPPHPAVH